MAYGEVGFYTKTWKCIQRKIFSKIMQNYTWSLKKILQYIFKESCRQFKPQLSLLNDGR